MTCEQCGTLDRGSRFCLGCGRKRPPRLRALPPVRPLPRVPRGG